MIIHVFKLFVLVSLYELNFLLCIEITKDGGESKATAKLLNYLSSIQEQYQKNLEEQIDQEIICDLGKGLHSWDTKYDLFELDFDEMKVIKEENSSAISQRYIVL